MRFDETITTAAGIEPAWAAVAAVTALPKWTRSIDSVTPLDGAALQVGRRYRVKQPGFPPVVWRVSEVRDGESFTWEASSPGVRSLAYHRLGPEPDGTTRISIGVHQTGPLAGVLGLLTGRRTRRYLRMEAAGLAAAAETEARGRPDGIGR
ncbi:MAG TPA: SRPBCC family protein [Micromonosporaceae bacterium]|nr:SRPBCC family protein [Micromonosporaceae bacterium]